MILELKHPLTHSPANERTASEARGSRRASLIAGALGFTCFLPYVAIPIGRATAIQVGTILSFVVLAPLLLIPRRKWGFWVFPLLMLPLALGAVKAGIAADDAMVCLKTVPVWAVAFMTILATQVCAPQYFLELLTGIAIAAILHAVIGAIQFYSFSHGEFPLAWFYINPSFLSVQDNADTIALYTQRPFGFFPEPSAMSSSLSPWVIFLVAEVCGIVRLRREPAKWQRVLFIIAAALALALIIISRSGQSAITIAAVMILIAMWFMRTKATPASFASVILVFGVLLPVVLYFAGVELADRLGGSSNVGNSSWEDRLNSLKIGWRLMTEDDVWTVIFGLGPGITSPILQRIARLEAVWSVLLTYIYETGLVGMFAVCWIGQYLFRIWKSMRFDATYILMFAVWLMGITLTTSYYQLLTLWVTLGWLIVWPAVCRSPSEAASKAGTFERTPPIQKLNPIAFKPRGRIREWISEGWRDPEKTQREGTGWKSL